MGILDKAKEKATQLAGQAKDKLDDVKDKRKVEDLLDDLGRIVYRQHTGRREPGDDAEIARLVAELKVFEQGGVSVLAPKVAPDGTGTTGTGTTGYGTTATGTSASDIPPPPTA